MSSDGGLDSAMLASMEQASHHGSSSAGHGMPSNKGLESTIGNTRFEDWAKQMNLDNNLAGVGGLNPVPLKPSFTNDIFGDLDGSGGVLPGNIEFNDQFNTNIGVGDVSAASGFGLPKAVNAEKDYSFGNIGDVTSR